MTLQRIPIQEFNVNLPELANLKSHFRRSRLRCDQDKHYMIARFCFRATTKLYAEISVCARCLFAHGELKPLPEEYAREVA